MLFLNVLDGRQSSQMILHISIRNKSRSIFS